MEAYAKQYHIPIMQEEGIAFLTSYIKEHGVKTILEIGSAIGYSAIQMALVDKQVHIVTIERDKERYDEALKNIREAKLENQIQVYLEDALLFSCDQKFDLIFIDAAKAQYIKFFERYIPNLVTDGAIVSDNLGFHGMVDSDEYIKNRNTRQLVKKIRNYIDYLKTQPDFETVFYKLGDGIALSKKRVIKESHNE